jgi:tetratricopeptide (TPR) repeat protein
MTLALGVASTFARWLSFSSTVEVPTGLTRATAQSLASTLLALLESSVVPESPMDVDEEQKDVLWAGLDQLAQITATSDEGLNTHLVRISKFIELLSRTRWITDELSERSELECRLLFLAWRSTRLLGDPVAAQSWLAKFESCLLNERPATFLLAEAVAARLPKIDEPGLFTVASPIGILGLCAVLRRQVNCDPCRFGPGAATLYRRVTSFSREWSPSERSYALGSIALIAGGAFRIAGRFDLAKAWLREGVENLTKLRSPTDVLAEVTVDELALCLRTGDCEEILRRLEQPAEWFLRTGAQRNLFRTRILKGIALKSAGRIDSAIEVLESALQQIRPSEEGLSPYALNPLAELYLIREDFGRARSTLELSYASCTRFGLIPTAVEAGIILGEVLRHERKYVAAVTVFSQAIAAAVSFGMPSMEARGRLVLAEVLIAIGSTEKALAELTTALPILRTQKMTPELLVATSLLREVRTRAKQSLPPQRT